MSRFLISFAISATALASPAAAQALEEEASDERIILYHPYRDSYLTVVASGSPGTLGATGQPVSIVTDGEIERVQGADIARLAERLPGVTLSRNGGLGGFTALRLRGAEGEQLLVLQDGVRVADASSPGGGFDFGTLLPAGIGKIELLRGSNSTIWGSQAMGGVMAIESASIEGLSASLEYGGPQSWYGQAVAGASHGALSLDIDGAIHDSEGFSAAAAGSESDGLHHWQAGTRAALHLPGNFTLRGGLRHMDARVEIDGFPAPDYLLADTGEFQKTRRSSGWAGIDYWSLDLELRAAWSLSDTERENFDPALGEAPSYGTSGSEERVDLRGRWNLANELALHFGAERSWSRMETLSDPRIDTASFGAYAQLGLQHGALVANAGLRREEHRGLGEAWNFGADAAYELGDGWRLRASYGEGFKAPSLFQLHSDYGNALLRPERSRGFDAGIEQGDRNSWLHLSLSAFRRDSTDLIQYVSCFGAAAGICADRPFGTYDNIGRARAQGIEAEIGWWPADRLRLQGVYSYVEARDRGAGGANQGRDLARRPRHALTLSADWDTPVTQLALGADIRVVSSSFDDAGNFVPLAGYEVLTLRASLPLTGEVSLFGRIENATDTEYQTAAGYATPGRSAYLGASARF